MIGAQVSELIAEVCLATEFHADSEDVARTCHPHPDAVGGPAAGRHGHRRMNDSILGARDDLGALEICGRCSNSGYTSFVERLARRIASFPAHTIAHVKAAVDVGVFGSFAEGLLVEAHQSDFSVASEVKQARVAEALKVGAETFEGEL